MLKRLVLGPQQSANVSVQAEGNLVLGCPFFSVPAARISWYFGNESLANDSRRVKISVWTPNAQRLELEQLCSTRMPSAYFGGFKNAWHASLWMSPDINIFSPFCSSLYFPQCFYPEQRHAHSAQGATGTGWKIQVSHEIKYAAK